MNYRSVAGNFCIPTCLGRLQQSQPFLYLNVFFLLSEVYDTRFQCNIVVALRASTAFTDTGSRETVHLTIMCGYGNTHRATMSFGIQRRRFQLYAVRRERYQAPLIQVSNSFFENLLADMERRVYLFCRRFVGIRAIAVMMP